VFETETPGAPETPSTEPTEPAPEEGGGDDEPSEGGEAS
jgi:hypothetical protein